MTWLPVPAAEVFEAKTVGVASVVCLANTSLAVCVIPKVVVIGESLAAKVTCPAIPRVVPRVPPTVIELVPFAVQVFPKAIDCAALDVQLDPNA